MPPIGFGVRITEAGIRYQTLVGDDVAGEQIDSGEIIAGDVIAAAKAAVVARAPAGGG